MPENTCRFKLWKIMTVMVIALGNSMIFIRMYSAKHILGLSLGNVWNIFAEVFILSYL